MSDLKNSELLHNFLTVEDFSKCNTTEIRIGMNCQLMSVMIFVCFHRLMWTDLYWDVETLFWKSIQIDRKTTETWKCLIDLLKEFQPHLKGPFAGLVHFTHLPLVPACHIHDIHSLTGRLYQFIDSLQIVDRVLKSVPGKLVKEKGQNLKSFLKTFQSSTVVRPPRPDFSKVPSAAGEQSPSDGGKNKLSLIQRHVSLMSHMQSVFIIVV